MISHHKAHWARLQANRLSKLIRIRIAYYIKIDFTTCSLLEDCLLTIVVSDGFILRIVNTQQGVIYKIVSKEDKTEKR
jgi:hypothetical protein